MLKLFQFPRCNWNLPNVSPACVKLETWLRITGIPYELAPFPAAVAPPKGKWPYIEDDNQVIADSALIIDHLRRSRHVDPDQDLSPTERAIGLAFRRTMKEHLNWVIIQSRYRQPSGWEAYTAELKPIALGFAGGDEQKLDELLAYIKTNNLGQLQGHGMGRHTDEEVQQFGCEDLIAVSDYLGDKPFFFGDRVTGIDATIFAYVSSVIDVPFESTAAQVAKQRKNLADYTRRMRQRYFADIAKDI